MCLHQNFVWVQRGPDVVKQPKPCGDCWQCRENRINDYCGRAMCEASTSKHTCFITMTYAPREDLAHKVVTPRHFQLFMKLLRRAGHKVRYLVTGEYGDLKGRAHFHALLFFEHIQPLQYRSKRGKLITRGQTPKYIDDYLPGTLPRDWGPFCQEVSNGKLRHIREWPHGHVQVKWNVTERNARYVCKYLHAENKLNAWFSLSKKPAIGAEWFARKAAKARELGVLPSSFEYLPPGGRPGKKYLCTGATRRDYLAACGPTDADRPRMSEWVQRTYDKHARNARMIEVEAIEKIVLRVDGLPPITDPDEDEITPVLPGAKLGNYRVFNPKPRAPVESVWGYLPGFYCEWPRKGDKPEDQARKRQLEAMYTSYGALGYSRRQIWSAWISGYGTAEEFEEARCWAIVQDHNDRCADPVGWAERRAQHPDCCSCSCCTGRHLTGPDTSGREEAFQAFLAEYGLSAAQQAERKPGFYSDGSPIEPYDPRADEYIFLARSRPAR